MFQFVRITIILSSPDSAVIVRHVHVFGDVRMIGQQRNKVIRNINHSHFLGKNIKQQFCVDRT